VHHEVDELEDRYDRAAALLRQAKRVAVLTGAGVSAESGVPTFRGGGGLWEGHPVEEVATPEGFRADPPMVWRFYNMRRAALTQVAPNPGHRALVALEERLGDQFTLITQNVDGLHVAAGSRRVLEVHGRLSRVRCTSCDYIKDRPGEALADLPECPECRGLLRPDVVWFNEMLPHRVWREACLAAERCDCFLVVGTSAVVYPAAGLVRTARTMGASVVEFNLEETPASAAAHVSLLGPSGRTLPEVVRRL
jgi:NAD-dependent deacetylase